MDQCLFCLLVDYCSDDMAVAFKVVLSLLVVMAMLESIYSVRHIYWSGSLHHVLRLQRYLLSRSAGVKESDGSITSFNDFWTTMKNLPQRTKRFKESRLCHVEVRNGYMESIAREDVQDSRVVRGELQKLLGNVPQINVLRRILRTQINLKHSISGYLKEPRRGDWYRDFDLDLDLICHGVDSITSEPEISITDICQDVDSCATERNSYTDPDIQWLPELSSACDRQRKCDIVKAFPLMAGIFWYRLTDWIEKRICLQRCNSWNDQVHQGYLKLLDEVKLLSAYATIMPTFWERTWSNFFNQAVENNAYTNVIVAMRMVEEKENVLNSTLIACNALKFTEACPYADIFVEYQFIKKSQENRRNPSPVKDLRLYSNLDHAKMLELQKDASNHIELLGQIRSLDENLKASVSGISTYFQGVARYDEGIADKDVQFIQGEIEKFNNSIIVVVEEVKDNIKTVVGLVQTQLGVALAREIITLALVIAENSNPMKLLFSGPDLDELSDATHAVAEASVDVAQIVALKRAIEELGNNTQEITLALYNNQEQITGLQSLVADIRENRMVSVRLHADKFIEEYGAYTPQVNRSALEKSNALWSAFKESVCGLSGGDAGIIGAISKGQINANLMCERLDGTLAQFFTLREDMFDFQFQLVDAVAKVVRGSISQRLAHDIRGKNDILHASQLMIGFFMMQNKLQNVASAYCDILEYNRLGDPISACSPSDGLFRYEHFDDLVAFKDKSPYAIIEREVFIPTGASYQGDTGYISLPALQSGRPVYFKLPVNATWLRENRWLLAHQTDVPFVESVSIYLPRKQYLTGEQQQHFTIQINVTTNGGSSVNTKNPETRVVYILPKGHSSYLTVYEEGYTTCPKEIENPYSLCSNLPKICDTSERHAGESVIPTILSTWKIQLSMSQGLTAVIWDAPVSSTDLKIRARVKLRVPLHQENRKKRSLKKKAVVKAQRSAQHTSSDMSSNGCCRDNRYRVSTENNRCDVCPSSSTSKHGGLYCEYNESK